MADLENHIRRYVSISAVIDTLRRKELAILDPQYWDDKNDSYFMNIYKAKNKFSSLYGLCATQSFETYHHWRVFTAGRDGACLEIRRVPLEKSLEQNENVRFGAVEYLKIEEIQALNKSDLERLPFCKRIGFAAEQEYRIIAWSGGKQAGALGIEIDLKWIQKIFLNPWMPKPLADSLKATLRELPGCDHIEVGRSLLIDSQRWKAAGDRVVGREPERPRIKLPRKAAKSSSKVRAKLA